MVVDLNLLELLLDLLFLCTHTETPGVTFATASFPSWLAIKYIDRLIFCRRAQISGQFL